MRLFFFQYISPLRRRIIGVTSKRRESSIIQKHLVYRPKLEEVIAKNILDVNPEIV